MSTITVTLACGCQVESDGIDPPVCEKHGERRVQRVTAPPPRITFG